jgi:hypothetical protein
MLRDVHGAGALVCLMAMEACAHLIETRTCRVLAIAVLGLRALGDHLMALRCRQWAPWVQVACSLTSELSMLSVSPCLAAASRAN